MKNFRNSFLKRTNPDKNQASIVALCKTFEIIFVRSHKMKKRASESRFNLCMLTANDTKILHIAPLEVRA